MASSLQLGIDMFSTVR